LINRSIVRCGDHHRSSEPLYGEEPASWHVPRCHPLENGLSPSLTLIFFSFLRK